MSNTYSVTPAIIPGALTVNGDLLVNGRTFRLGTGLRKFRIQETGIGAVYQGLFNDDAIAGALDDAGQGTAQFFFASNLAYLGRGVTGAAPTVRIGTDGSVAPSFVVLEDGMRLGAASHFVRLFKRTVNPFMLSGNLGTDLLTRDDATMPGFVFSPENAQSKYFTRFVNPAGLVSDGALGQIFLQFGTPTTVTGTIADTTIVSKVVRGNTLGPQGIIVARWHVRGNAQGAFATLFNFKFGGSSVTISRAVNSPILVFECILSMQNLTNSENALITGLDYSNGAFLSTQTDFVVDTTVDQTLAFSIQPGAVGDSWTSKLIDCFVFTGAAAAI